MHPHLKASRDGAKSKLARISGAHGTAANPAGNKPLPMEVAPGPQGSPVLGAEGGKPNPNLGKFARGGRAKHKGTNVNVIVAPGAGGGAAPPPMPPAMMRPPMPAGMPPAPPPAGPPPPMGGAPGMPGGLMPPRKSGGRTFNKGGRVFEAGSGSGEGREEKAKAAAGNLRKQMKVV